MARDHLLMLTLCVIIAINIIAIVLLNNHLADTEQAGKPASPQKAVIRNQPVVRTVLLTDPACDGCFNISAYAEELQETIAMEVEQTADTLVFNSPRLPAIAFNSTIAQYPVMVRGWEEVGYRITIPDGTYKGEWYVLPTLNPPYSAGGRVHGKVGVVYLTLRSCSQCYDIFITRGFMEESRIVVGEEQVIDAESAEGRALVQRYNLTAVPTIIMDSEAAEYSNIQPGWGIMGTVEEDGSYVLRDLQRLRVTYYDLAHKKLMKP
jgi:hypothetical protein